MEIQSYYERETNNNDQKNEYIVIVPDTQDIPSQAEKNVSNSVKDNFFLHDQGATKSNQRRN